MKKPLILALTLISTSLQAQTYTQLQWGVNKGVNPYQFGANINGTWSNLGTVSSTGTWAIPVANISGSCGLSILACPNVWTAGQTINLTGLAGPTAGSRAPLLIWNNPNGSTPAGYNAGQQIWIGDNLVATPGAGDTVGSTIFVGNGNNRTYLYGENLIVGQCGAAEGCSASYLDSNMYGLEINTYSSASFSVSQDAFRGGVGGTYLKNMLMLTPQGPQHMSSAIALWSANSNGSSWPYEGVEISRITNNGLHFVVNPNLGITDSATAFNNAAIYDESNSSRVLKVKGTHDSVISVEENPTISMFVRAPYGVASTLPIRNVSNNNLTVTIDSGGNATQNSALGLSDQGSIKWLIQKDTSTAFNIYNASRANTDISVSNSTGSVAFRGGSPQVTLGTNASLAGGLAIANGGVGGVSATIANPSTTVAYNFNLPSTAGTSSYLLTSAGGGSSPMTWTSPTISINSTNCTLGSSCTVPSTSIPFPSTVSGTVNSGGIPYFNSTTQMSSSALLAANALMIGGGAGAAPSTTTTGTGVITAIGNATNSSGGLVTFSGNIGAATGTSLALGGATIGTNALAVTGTAAISGAVTTGGEIITSTSTNALTVGANGSTNPAFNVDASTASSATGINIKSAAAAGGIAMSAISSGTNENLTINAKGSGTISLNGTATGAVSTGTDLLVGGGSNAIGLSRAAVINAPAAGSTGFLFSVNGVSTAYFSSATSYAQLLTATNAIPLLLGTNNTARWKIDASTGHFLANVDATYNIGAAGATRPLNVYASGTIYASSYASTGTKPTATGAGGTCAAGTVTGGATVGTVALTAACANTNTLALTSMPTATTGYVCDAADRTSGVLNLVQTATSTTSATFTFNATTGATDVIQFKCMAY